MKKRDIIVINYNLWLVKEGAIEYMDEIINKIGLPVRVNGATDCEWNHLVARFGNSIERGVALHV